MKTFLTHLSRSILFISLMMATSSLHASAGRETDITFKHDWTVSNDPSAKKLPNEYDVIVVGSGIGGLSCASILSTHGYKVLVAEQHSHVGGYCTGYERNGFTFPVGAADISGCERGAIASLLQQLNLKKDDLFVLHTRTYIFGDKKITFTGANNDTVEKFSELFPHEHRSLIDFFAQARRATDEFLAAAKDPSQPQPTFDSWKAVTYQQKLDEFFQDADLKKCLCSLIGYLGTTPENTTASDALLACLRYFLYGGHYPKQGGKLFAEALSATVKSHGGTVLTNAPVDEILVHDGHVTGVRVGTKTYLSSIVVANANAKTLFLQLLPKGSLNPAFTDTISSLKTSKTGAVINLGLDLDLSALSSKIDAFPELKDGKVVGDKIDFMVISSADPASVPPGCASISIGVDARYTDVPPLGTPEYRMYKEALAESAIAKIEKLIPNIRQHIVVNDVITPRTFEHFTSMPEGAFYPFDQSQGSSCPFFKTPITGLYLASASTFIGGVEAVAMAGMVCQRDIERARKTTTTLTQNLSLPAPSLTGTVSLETAIHERRSTRHFKNQPLSLSQISQLLWASQGITHQNSLRAAPSAGGCYPLTVYLVAGNVTGLAPGVYTYIVEKHALQKCSDGDLRSRLCAAAFSQRSVEEAAATIVIGGVYEGVAKKYGAHAQDFTWLEAGCVAENVALQAISCGLGTVCVAGFTPQAVQEIVGMPEEIQPLCLLPLGIAG